MRFTGSRTALCAIALAIAGAVMLLVAVSVGSANVGVLRSLSILLDVSSDASAAQRTIVLNVRLPRALLSYVVGGGLALAGAAMQGLFRNPLADSHALGISGGAGLGAALAILMGLGSSVLGIGLIPLFAFLGGLIAVVLVMALSAVRGRSSLMRMLLAGFVVASLCSALTSGIMILGRDKMERVLLFVMGSFSSPNLIQLAIAAALIMAGCVVCLAFHRELDIMLLGEEAARNTGVEIESAKRVIIASCVLVSASSVAMSGVIGFVGLIAPHAVRLFAGSKHSRLLPLSFLAGGLFMLVADTLSRTILTGREIPVGIITALAGGPLFLVLLRRREA